MGICSETFWKVVVQRCPLDRHILIFGYAILNRENHSIYRLFRWVLKVQALEEKKRHYEGVLQRELDGLDDEFSFLKLLSQELQVRAKSIRSQRFQHRAA